MTKIRQSVRSRRCIKFLAAAFVVAGCGGTEIVSSADQVVDPVETIVPTRFANAGLSCPTELAEDAVFDFEENPPPLTAENTATSAAAWFMSEQNPDFRLRPDDWQLLALDLDLSTDNVFFYVDGEGHPYLRLDVSMIGDSWQVSGFTSCTLISDSGPNASIVPAVERPPTPSANEGDGAPDGVEFILPTEEKYPPDLLLSCGGFGTIDPAALTELPPLLTEAGFPEAELAIASFLEGGEGNAWPEDLRLTHRGSDSATVVSLEDGRTYMILVERDETGEWGFFSSSVGGDCELEVIWDDGLNVVDFVIENTDPLSSVVVVNATERECVGGQPIGDRLAAPRTTQGADVVYFYLAAEPPTDSDVQTCEGNPSEIVEIDLVEPLGDRAVINARSFGQLSEFWPAG